MYMFRHPCFWVGVVLGAIALSVIIAGAVYTHKLQDAVETGGWTIDTSGCTSINVGNYVTNTNYTVSGQLGVGQAIAYYYKRQSGDEDTQSALKFYVSGSSLTMYGNSDFKASAANYTARNSTMGNNVASLNLDLCYVWEVAFVNITNTGNKAQNYTLTVSFLDPASINGVCNLINGLVGLGIGIIWLIFGLVAACFCCCALGFFGGWAMTARRHHHHHMSVNIVQETAPLIRN